MCQVATIKPPAQGCSKVFTSLDLDCELRYDAYDGRLLEITVSRTESIHRDIISL